MLQGKALFSQHARSHQHQWSTKLAILGGCKFEFQNKVLLQFIELLHIRVLLRESLKRAIQAALKKLRALLLVGMKQDSALLTGVVAVTRFCNFAAQGAIGLQFEMALAHQKMGVGVLERHADEFAFGVSY